MSRVSREFLKSIGIGFLFWLAVGVAPAWGQAGSTGTVTVTVVDQQGGVISDAQLQLQDIATNDVRTAVTQDRGTYSFVNLPIGAYKLTVTHSGFQTQVFSTVTVQAAQVTDLTAALKVGSQNATVTVTESATPLVETTTNTIGSTIDLKQIENLPIQGRDLTQLSFLIPGAQNVPNGASTWNGLPAMAQGNNIDGVISSTSRMKFGGNAEPNAEPRLEDIQQMTVQTDQLDANQGFGQAAMQINFITRRGTNSFHGRVFDDYRNSGLNANTWLNDATGLGKNKLILNEFGGSLGGPIIHNKLFFFGDLSVSKQPGSINASNSVLTPAAQAGNFSWTDATGAPHTVNVLNQIAGPAGLNTRPDQVVFNTELPAINTAIASGKLATTSDPNIESLNWLSPSPTTIYFPTVRVDYNLSSAIRLNFAFNDTKENQPSVTAPLFPGAGFANQVAGNKTTNYTAAFGLDWTLRPTLVDQFRGGYLYNYSSYAYNTTLYRQNPLVVNWNLPAPGSMSGQGFPSPVSTYYPLFNASDTATWQHAAHTVRFGFSFYREQDHYWNPPAGITTINLGLVTGDPALGVFQNSPLLAGASAAQKAEAGQLYAVLTGRIGGGTPGAINGTYAYDPKTGQYFPGISAYNLNELQKAWGLFFQDSFRWKPTLTVNYGLRWDFTGDDHDLTSAYHGVSPADLFGPSGFNNEFHPGSLLGNPDPQFVASSHQYKPWNVSPQPQIGIAWAPQYSQGFMGRLTGGGNTVIRAGFALRRYTEPYQFFWDAASDYGAFFYQGFTLNGNTTGAPGTFAPGSLTLQPVPAAGSAAPSPYPPYLLIPPVYPQSYPESAFTFIYPFQQVQNIALSGIDPHISQPYVQSWNLGFQRTLGAGNAIEIRYLGSRTVHQWLNLYTNEVNVVENGFLTQFQAAQANLAANQTAGLGASFANHGLPGQQTLPIFNAAFTGEAAGPDGAPVDYTNGQFINYLQQGQAGAFATALTGIQGTVPYFCNLVGSGFSPCVTNANFTGAGAGYPINFFQANPFVSGQDTGFMMSGGYSTYNALQVDFRQKQWHGMQFDVNYTWSNTLGLQTGNQWTGQFNQYTLRDLHLSYGPSLTDLRHVVHASGTYDLPFGSGKRYLNRSGWMNRAAGGWTIGTIFTFQTGAPFQLQGGYLTLNDYADGGVVLNGVSVSQLQNSIGVYRIPPQATPTGPQAFPFVGILNPRYLASPTGGGSNTALLSPNATPGTIGSVPFLFGPHFVNDDIAISKIIPIKENLRFSFQGEFLNVFNHPNFGTAFGQFGPNVQNLNFGLGAPINEGDGFGRQIELRANIEF